jgi:hypothetical protein
MNARNLEAAATLALAGAVALAYAALSELVLADHVVASLLSPGGLTPRNLALAAAWVGVRLLAMFGVPALLSFGVVRLATAPRASP